MKFQQTYAPLQSIEQQGRTGISYKRHMVMALFAILLSAGAYMLLFYVSWLHPETFTKNGVTVTVYIHVFSGLVGVLFFLLCGVILGTFVTCKGKFVYWGVEVYLLLLGVMMAYVSSSWGINFYNITFPYIDNTSYGFFIAIALAFIWLLLKTPVIRFLTHLLELSSRGARSEPHD
jgi:hypothetical protein